MKFTRLYLTIFIIFFNFSCGKQSKEPNVYDFIKKISEKVKNETGLKLTVYGFNCSVPKEYVIKKGIYNVCLTYWLHAEKQDEISLEDLSPGCLQSGQNRHLSYGHKILKKREGGSRRWFFCRLTVR